MISPLAFVSPDATIGNNVTIAPFAYVEEGVVIGDNCTIHAHASILSGTTLGQGNKVYQGAVLGAEPQDFRYKGEPTQVVIGDNNTFRENVVVNRSSRVGGATTIGNENFFCEGSHLAHDSVVESNCILANGVKVAGDCLIQDHAILSNLVAMNEGTSVGAGAMVQGGVVITRDVPPYIIASNSPISYGGVNVKILISYCKFSQETLSDLAMAYNFIYGLNISLLDALSMIENEMTQSPEVRNIIEFARHSKLGLIPKA